MAHALELAWNPAARKQDGLDTIRNALIAIENDRPLDPLTARHLADALRLYLTGQTDLTRNLGLRPRRGCSNEAPLRKERLLERDALIVEALEGLGGNTPENRADLHGMLDAYVLRLPETWRFVPAVNRLRAMNGGVLKLSEKQIQRIAKGQTAYSQRNG